MNLTLFMPLIQQLLMTLMQNMGQQPLPVPPPPPPPPLPGNPPLPGPLPTPSDGTMQNFLKNLAVAVMIAAAQEVMKELPQIIARQKKAA